MSKTLFTPDFAPSTRDDWRDLVRRALDGQDPEQLKTRSYDDIDILPLYAGDAETDEGIDRAPSIDCLRPSTEFHSRGAWDIRVLHTNSDPATTNRAIRDDLSGGANSICIQMAAPGQFGLTATKSALSAALGDVFLDAVHTSIQAGDQYLGAAMALMELWDEQEIPEAQWSGAFHADPLGHLARTGSLEDKLYDSLRTLGHFIAANHAKYPGVTLMLADGRPYHEAGASEAQLATWTLVGRTLMNLDEFITRE